MLKNFEEPFEFESRDWDRDKVKCKIETTAVASTALLILTHTADSTIKRIVWANYVIKRIRNSSLCRLCSYKTMAYYKLSKQFFNNKRANIEKKHLDKNYLQYCLWWMKRERTARVFCFYRWLILVCVCFFPAFGAQAHCL